MSETIEGLKKRVAELEEEVAELERRPEESALRYIASYIPDNIMVLDHEERIEFINWTVPDLTLDQVIGTPAYRFLPEEFQPVMQACYARVRETGRPSSFEVTYVAKNGAESRWDSRVAPIMHGDLLEGFLQVSSNVTEREESVAERERFFALSIDILLVFRFDARIKRVNPAATQLLGWAPEELEGRSGLDLVHPDDLDRARHMLTELIEGRSLIDFECRYRHKDGGYRLLQWQGVSVPSLELIYAVARDVTERRTFETQLLQAQKMEVVGQLAGGVAQDFNNSLLAILVDVDTALKNASGGLKDTLTRVRGSAERAAAVTKQLLAFSRRQPMQPEKVQLNSLLGDMMGILRRLMPERIELGFRPERHVPPTQIDPVQIEQVLLNLFINARDAMPQGGRLELETHVESLGPRDYECHPWARPGLYVLLKVSDTGTGMTEDTRKRAFEPFFTTKPPGESTGLGLSTVYGIVQQHQGVVRLDSTPGFGTTVKLYLPIVEEGEGTADLAEHARVRGGDETLLVAEDDSAVRQVVLTVLEDAGYRVLAVESGEKAIEVMNVHGGEVDLALLDVVMPKLSGPQTYSILQSKYPDLGVLFTSGYSDGAFDEDPGLMDRLLRKPYKPDDLLRHIRYALDERAARIA